MMDFTLYFIQGQRTLVPLRWPQSAHESTAGRAPVLAPKAIALDAALGRRAGKLRLAFPPRGIREGARDAAGAAWSASSLGRQSGRQERESRRLLRGGGAADCAAPGGASPAQAIGKRAGSAEGARGPPQGIYMRRRERRIRRMGECAGKVGGERSRASINRSAACLGRSRTCWPSAKRSSKSRSETSPCTSLRPADRLTCK